MTNTAHPVLCGGTFLVQILQSRKPTASRRQRTKGSTDIFREPDVLYELVKIVQPDYIRPAGDTFRTYTTNYKKCAEYTPDDLKFVNDSVVSEFLTRLEKEYTSELKKTAAFVNQFIDVSTTTQNHVLLVKRLIEIIRDDKSISATVKFAVGWDNAFITKNELTDVTEVYLPAFLLSIWKFIVTQRKDNSIGAATIAAWFPKETGRYKGINGLTINQKIKVDCDPLNTIDVIAVMNDDDRSAAKANGTEDSAPTTEPQAESKKSNTTTVERSQINTDYYNLFVISDEIKNCRFTMPKDRSLRSDTKTVKKFADFSADAIKQIISFPSLFMNENIGYSGRTSQEQEAYYGFVTNLRVQENGVIKVYFQCEAKVNQQQINNIARLLDIYEGPGVMELNHTHWTIKNVNLIEELTEANLLPNEYANEYSTLIDEHVDIQQEHSE